MYLDYLDSQVNFKINGVKKKSSFKHSLNEVGRGKVSSRKYFSLERKLMTKSALSFKARPSAILLLFFFPMDLLIFPDKWNCHCSAAATSILC